MNDSKDNVKTVRTSTLFRRLFRAPNLDSYINENAGYLIESAFSDYLSELCVKMGLIRNQVIIRSGIERSFGHQIFRGIRKPSRDIVIRLAFGFGLNVDETQTLLAVAHKSTLFPKIRRDAAILYCINRHADVTDAQALLDDLGLDMLRGEAENEPSVD